MAFWVQFMALASARCTCVAETSNRETKHRTQRIGEFRFIMLACSEELTLQALSPEQRVYRVFIDRLYWARVAANRLI